MKLSRLLCGVFALAGSAMSAAAAELVVNGSFEAGNVGFTSDYTYVSGPAASARGTPTYAIATAPASAANAYPDWGTYGDHTSGTGKMLIADASAANAWSENVVVHAGTTYTYSFWARQADGASNSNPVLHFSVNGTGLGDLAVSSGSSDGWQQKTGTYTAMTSGAVTLAVADTNSSVPYNDFALDDISFTGATTGTVPEPASWALMLAGFGVVGGVMRRRATAASVTA